MIYYRGKVQTKSTKHIEVRQNKNLHKQHQQKSTLKTIKNEVLFLQVTELVQHFDLTTVFCISHLLISHLVREKKE